MDDVKTLAIFGAAGTTGKHLVKQAVAAGHRVRAFEPNWPGNADMPAGVEKRTADIMKGGFADALDGCDAVLSAIGLGIGPKTAIAPPPIYTEGAVNLVREMQRAQVRRLVVISASFVASRRRGPLWFQMTSSAALDRVFTQMAEMERILRAADDIDWTAVRPGWLMEGELTADYVVTPDVIPPDLIRTRHADLAHFMLDCVVRNMWVNATPAIARAEPRSASTPGRLVSEVLNS
ncbi:putative NADH-flavin reductase [Palleronia aestuarii]|uniref:Putative NADH-flavin reductase n=1 Tax=Palleronia aestuarii TaxID=568105 RepID=A0A2W7NVJ0_9RHOB|nr:NAD(P)H-binding protein [Palleronia aestuarii]PZX15242.1 putative NADH-flavin reductase [Palleronia aestuarii]